MTTDGATLVRQLGREFCGKFPAEAAAELERSTTEETAGILADCPAAAAAAVLHHLSPDTAAYAMAAMDPEKAAKIVETVQPPAAARLVRALDEDPRERVLARLSAARAEEVRRLVAYPPRTAGALMDPEVLALAPSSTVGDALKKLRRQRDKRVHRVYLVDADRKLIGSVSIRDLALEEPRMRLDQLEVVPPYGVQAMATHEEVVDTLAQSRTASLPVLDMDGGLLGVLRQDALVKVTREDATVDIQSMVGAGKQERALSRVSLAVRKRLPWLQVNLVTAFLAASVVGLFESTIARYTALAVLLPVVAGQSGNTGAQALAVTMRGLALREIHPRQWMRVCFKEAKVGAINGVAVAVTTALGVLIWSRSTGLALVIGLSMVLSMVAAGLSGAAVPIVLTTLRQDPAQSSSIILTTVTDVVGFFSFLGIATLLMGVL